jgi:hypothetical protein
MKYNGKLGDGDRAASEEKDLAVVLKDILDHKRRSAKSEQTRYKASVNKLTAVKRNYGEDTMSTGKSKDKAEDKTGIFGEEVVHKTGFPGCVGSGNHVEFLDKK